MVRIRLQRMGAPHRPFYRIVAIDARKPRDSPPLEIIGTYDPLAKSEEDVVKIKSERLKHWLNVGAQPTGTVKSLLKRLNL